MRPASTQTPVERKARDKGLRARVAVLEQQIVDQKEATVIALAAADKAIVNAVVVADKAVAKVELAAEKTALEASIASLEKAFGQQIAHTKELTAQALASADKAVLKAEVAAEKRFESVNEFRSTLSDQQRELATKTECDLRFAAMDARISDVMQEYREMKGHGLGGREAITDRRSESSDSRGLIFSIIMAVIAVAALLAAIVPHLAK